MPIHPRSLSVTDRWGRWRPFTRTEWLLVRELYEEGGGWLPTDRLVEAMTADDPAGGPLDAARVVYVTLRRAGTRLFGSEYGIEYRRERDGFYRLALATIPADEGER